MATILVIENDKTILRAFETLLKKQNYDVITATDGKQAIEILQKTKPNLIITELFLPYLTGEEIITFARNKWQKIPIIVVSFKNNLEKRLNVVILKKPIDFTILLRHIQFYTKKVL